MKKHHLLISLLAILVLGGSCSHDYEASTLDLSFYQWNFWLEEDAGMAGPFEPSCGWDDMHRGMGKLVRIPATVGEHFSDSYAGVSWFHTRFTLPELWAGRQVLIQFEGVNGNVQLFLEGELVGEHPLSAGPFSIDVSEHIFYTRDNHLCIRVSDPRPGKGGLSGKLTLRSVVPESETLDSETPGSETSHRPEDQ